MKYLLAILACLFMASCNIDTNPGNNPGHERIKTFTCEILANTQANKIDWSIKTWIIPSFFIQNDTMTIEVTKDGFDYKNFDDQIGYVAETKCAKDLYELLLVQNKDKLDKMAHQAVEDLSAEDTRKK